MNRDTLLLAVFVAMLMSASAIHEPLLLAVLLLGGIAASYPHTRWVITRTLLFPLLFTGITLGAYALFIYWQTGALPETLAVILLRIMAMSVWSFALVKRVNLIRALEGFSGLQFLLVISRSQIELFARSAAEAKRAYRSRSIAPPSLFATWRFYAGLYAALLEKALQQSKNVSRSMRSRGVFDA